MTIVRKAHIEDIKSLTNLFDKYRVFYEKETDKANAEKFILERLTQNDSVIFVADNGEKTLMGFVQLYPIFSSTRMKRLWLLNDLFVDDNYRGNSISKKLIEASKKLCEDTDACGLVLETAKTNVIGNTLYPNVGFSIDQEHNYYSWDRE